MVIVVCKSFSQRYKNGTVFKFIVQIRVRVVVGKYNCLKYHRTLIVGLKLLITKGREQVPVPVDRQRFSTFGKTERKNSFCKITIYLYL
jgi:hypothetical protein